MPLEIPQNHFELFQLPSGLDVDTQVLTQRYRALQKELHPDRFAAASAREQRLAAQAAAHVNQAHRVLKDPHQRAAYLLEMQGLKIDGEKDTSQDTDFLMQQMEWRERLEELEDMAQTEAYAKELNQEADELWEGFRQHCEKNHWDQARETLLKLHFYRRLKQQLQATQSRLSGV